MRFIDKQCVEDQTTRGYDENDNTSLPDKIPVQARG